MRIFRNRITNYRFAISGQPVRGGPLYVFRNLIYNITRSPFKLHKHTAGILLFRNTSVRSGTSFLINPATETVNDVISRNNLFIGTAGSALRSAGRMIRSDFDNDGFAWGEGPFLQWNRKMYQSPIDARQRAPVYSVHGAIIVHAGRAFGGQLWPPKSYSDALPANRNRPILSEKSRAVDKGVRLPNFDDQYAGTAPDLGCCEAGQALLHFGPRPRAECQPRYITTIAAAGG